MKANRDFLNRLRALLAEKFNLDELFVLLNVLDVSIEDVPRINSVKEARVVEIIEYFERRDRLPELLAACQHARPQTDWPTLDGAPQNRSGTASPTVLPGDTHRTATVSQAIDVLENLRHNPQANKEIVLMRSVLQSASDRIVELTHYKQLHDDFQELEVSYNVIESHSEWLAQGATVWNALTQHLAEAQGVIDDLGRTTREAGLENSEALWLGPLGKARTAVQSAIDAQEPKWLTSASDLINRVLDRGPTRVNGQLVRAVRELLKLEVAAHMRTLHDSLARDSHIADQLKTFSEGVAVLDQVRAQLQSLVEDHDKWQVVDVELNRVNSEVKRDAEKLELGWLDVAPMMQPLTMSNGPGWAKELNDTGIIVQQALQVQDLKRARTKFIEYRSKAGNRFRQVDDDLLKVCNELKIIGVRLQEFLQRLGA